MRPDRWEMRVMSENNAVVSGNHSQKEVPSGPSASLKLEGVVLMHIVEVKLCVARSSAQICSWSAALGMGRVTCSKLNEISLKLERRESPSTGNFTLVQRPCPPRPAAMPMSSSPGGGRRQGSDPIIDGKGGDSKLPSCVVWMCA